MSKSLATDRRTTSKADFLDIILDTYLYDSRKEARYALEAVACAWRNWMLASAQSVPVHSLRVLRIPGVGSIRFGWREYNGHAPKLTARFSPTPPVRELIRKQNKAAYQKWKEAGK